MRSSARTSRSRNSRAAARRRRLRIARQRPEQAVCRGVRDRPHAGHGRPGEATTPAARGARALSGGIWRSEPGEDMGTDAYAACGRWARLRRLTGRPFCTPGAAGRPGPRPGAGGRTRDRAAFWASPVAGAEGSSRGEQASEPRAHRGPRSGACGAGSAEPRSSRRISRRTVGSTPTSGGTLGTRRPRGAL